ncbi:MAG TPA: lysophospholipid acyltransferase family protein [Dehalococcoidia bacterium]|nr:lysophospholipid acyltransferase family protein [Dehalococcoidia bacterium]
MISRNDWKLWALLLGVRLGRVLPRSVSYAIARVGADLAFQLRPSIRGNVEDNMRHVLGAGASRERVRATAREAVRNVARYYVDLVRLPRTDLKAMIGHEIRLHGFDRLTSRLEAGQGVVVATAHYGNPEVAVQVGAILGLDVLVLAEPLEPPAFARLMRQLRSAFAPRYEDVGFGAVADSLRHLRAGGCLAITCDRDIQHNGSPVEFFGVETSMPLGAVEFAMRTGAALIPGYCRRKDEGYDIYFEEPVPLVDTGSKDDDALTNARALLERVEVWLRADPSQWFVLQRIWGTGVPAKPPRPKMEPAK